VLNITNVMRKDIRLTRTFWFIALWCVGVGGALLLALPFELLMHMAMR